MVPAKDVTEVDGEELFRGLELALGELSEERGQDFAAALRSIVFTNLERGRVKTFLTHQDGRTARDYVLWVAEYYDKYHQYLYELKILRLDESWDHLYKEMCKSAYRLFIRKGFPVNLATKEQAEGCAREAVGQIIKSHFPFDVDFVPWMCVLLRNVCCKEMRPQPPLFDQDITELEFLLTNIAQQTNSENERLQDFRVSLLEVLEDITPARKKVIWLHYFENKPFPEIARLMERSISAVYQLHFHALRDLNKRLESDEFFY